MSDMYAIDNCINEYEFRGFVAWYLINHDYKFVSVGDSRLSDTVKENDNDIIMDKEKTKYTVQTYLNKQITEKEIEETFTDMIKEDVNKGIIFTNLEVTEKMIEKAVDKNIIILDRKILEKDYHDYRNR